VQTLPDPASAAEAMDQVLSGLRYLAAADPTAMAAQAQAECLQGLEQAEAISTAARAWYLAALAAEIYARSLPEGEDDPEPRFEDRRVRVETTFAGAGVAGDLTPECAAVVTAVLESLSAPLGAEDTRTRDQRYHDALQEAMSWLMALRMQTYRYEQACMR
jgi:hypothetical protein